MATTASTRKTVDAAYEAMLAAYGPQHWWPADTPFEVCVGAILTQSTSWANVESAIGNLKRARLMSLRGISSAPERRLARLIRPSLYYNVKARKLKEFARFLKAGYGGRVGNMSKTPLPELREELLAVWGLGPETVDSILLYALELPSFVVDAYTKRIFSRMGLVREGASYDDVKSFFESNLPRRVRIYNEYHALIVRHGKEACRTKPRCEGCVLRGNCAY